MPIRLSPTPIGGMFVAETDVNVDSRGTFARLFAREELSGFDGAIDIAHVNLSRTTTVGAVRGLHFQNAPFGETKLIRCLRGRVWDVAVDLRTRSPTFLRWVALELSRDNMQMAIIPRGVAHGFQVLERDSDLLYLHTSVYVPEAEGGIRYDDPRLAITWPLPVTEISARDAAFPNIRDDFEGVVI